MSDERGHTGARQGGAWLSLGGQRVREDQKGLLEVAAPQLHLHWS